MKEIIEVRSNQMMHVNQTDKVFELKPTLELIIAYADGKTYHLSKEGTKLFSGTKISETRFLCSLHTLDVLIAELQLHRRSLDQLSKNTSVLNQIAKSIMEDIPKEETPGEQK
jgi:hypothetical protein